MNGSSTRSNLLAVVPLLLTLLGTPPRLALAQDTDAQAEVEIVPETAKDSPPTEARDQRAVAGRIAEQANEFRRQQDRSQLRAAPELTATAEKFARYMARHHRYGHAADGKTPAERAEAEGYEYCIVRENIAYQFSTRELGSEELARRNSEGWEESPEHRENLLDPDVTEIGIGVAQSADTGYYFAVQLFGRPKSAAIQFSVTNRSETAVEYDLDGKSFTLQPRQIRTHTRCRPPKFVVKWPASSGGKEETFRPGGGDRFAVVGTADHLELKKEATSP